ncbi:hypothetical protein BDP27DRAFT_1425916 [Rhodocollybia butyracea]|uniref:Uncharacterized protein n=1 Tax=Rhodocollybia butyracea TaxID=206335 RepID=A0A9P5PLS0_9AGAR|nr:hypothetical protein BDP27DRAFT_1425916 [Rhodocollybia butyracea]
MLLFDAAVVIYIAAAQPGRLQRSSILPAPQTSAPPIPTASSKSGSNSSAIGAIAGGIAALVILVFFSFLRVGPEAGAGPNFPYDPFNSDTLPASELTPTPFMVQRPTIGTFPSTVSQTLLSDSGIRKTAGLGLEFGGGMNNVDSSGPIDSSSTSPISPASLEQPSTNKLLMCWRGDLDGLNLLREPESTIANVSGSKHDTATVEWGWKLTGVIVH